MASICPCLCREISRSIKIKQAECVSWKGEETLCHSSLAIVVKSYARQFVIEGEREEELSPRRETFTSGLSNDLINMTATVVPSCPGAIELEPWQPNWI